MIRVCIRVRRAPLTAREKSPYDVAPSESEPTREPTKSEIPAGEDESQRLGVDGAAEAPEGPSIPTEAQRAVQALKKQLLHTSDAELVLALSSSALS